ncbi:importin alpha subunit [Anaeramoeba flamelloides]|uniref:Importin alpha subunit n=1 Tax=Anaeramoeba flamelloides TaxID=1746091 RepID=A0ABQ8Y733_9EUKA|nr:importin alpha subunit [Anaeramoeba flamelloides]
MMVKKLKKEEMFESIHCIRLLLGIEVDPPIEEIINAGFLPILIDFLNYKEEKFRIEAAWAISNITTSGYKYRNLLMKEQILPIFTKLLLSENDGTHEHIQNFLTIIQKLLVSEDEEILSNTCWIFFDLIQKGDSSIYSYIHNTTYKLLVQLLAHESISIQTPLLYCIIKFFKENYKTETLFTSVLIRNLLKLLQNGTNKQKSDICYFFSNVFVLTPTQLDMILKNNYIPVLMEIVQNGNEKLKQAAACVLSNLIYISTLPQLLIFYQEDCIISLATLLLENDNDILLYTLESIHKLLMFGSFITKSNGLKTNKCIIKFKDIGGFEFVSNLQNHVNIEIRNRASFLFNNFFK